MRHIHNTCYMIPLYEIKNKQNLSTVTDIKKKVEEDDWKEDHLI